MKHFTMNIIPALLTISNAAFAQDTKAGQSLEVRFQKAKVAVQKLDSQKEGTSLTEVIDQNLKTAGFFK